MKPYFVLINTGDPISLFRDYATEEQARDYASNYWRHLGNNPGVKITVGKVVGEDEDGISYEIIDTFIEVVA